MNREAIYETWVPQTGSWSLWARPVLFGQMSATSDPGLADPTPIRWAWDLFGQTSGTAGEQPWLNLPIDWPPPVQNAAWFKAGNTLHDKVAQFSAQMSTPETIAAKVMGNVAGQSITFVPRRLNHAQNAGLILDLPGAEGVHLGLALAGHGYRPVPLYNGCTGPSELLDQGPILRALRDGAVFLAALALPSDAPPAFLLDSRRQSLPRPLRPGMLDNRWQVFPEDFPSAQLLEQRGVSRVIWIGYGKPQEDLARVLRVWQEAQIALEAKDLTIAGAPHPLIVPPTPWWRRWWNRLRSQFGLQGRPRDGFGYIVSARTHG